MAALTNDPGIYIRSMANRGVRGGLASATPEVIDVLDAAGFDVILVESVGAGQGEFEISDLVDTTLIVSAPGLGDDVQAIKAGMLEMADIHVVNKADRSDAQRTVGEIEGMLAMAGSRRRRGRTVPVIATCAMSGTGIGDLVAAIIEHACELDRGARAERRYARVVQRVLRSAVEMIERDLQERMNAGGAVYLNEVHARRMSPRAAAAALLEQLWGASIRGRAMRGK